MTLLCTYGDVEFGAATHVGRVRIVNEDDYLIVAPCEIDELRTCGRLVAIADGMGGVEGGAEASRAAIRAIGASLAAPGCDRDPRRRLHQAFDLAGDRVHELAGESSRLAEMGTTLTAVLLIGSRAWIGHIGDTRCLRIRRGEVEQLTEDHAMREPRNLLTRAIGAGQRHETADIVATRVRPGDVLVLCTDGVWGVVGAVEIAREMRSADLGEACERVVRMVWERGAPDNATLVAVRIVSTGGPGVRREVELPGREARVGPGRFDGADARLVPARWPLVLLGLSLVLGCLAWLRLERGFDVLTWLGGVLR